MCVPRNCPQILRHKKSNGPSTYCGILLHKYALMSAALMYRDADKSLARPGRKQAPKHVTDARHFSNNETRAVIKFLFLQGKAPKEIQAILTETLACFLPGRAKDLSAPCTMATTHVTKQLTDSTAGSPYDANCN